jgi:hypothetical protein
MALLIDEYLDDEVEALKAAMGRRASNPDHITRIEKTGYGNFRVFSVPVDMYVELDLDNPSSNSPFISRSNWANAS